MAAMGSIIFADEPRVGVFRSTDSGRTWENCQVPNDTSVGQFAVNGTNLFIVTDSGLFLSKDSGVSWTYIVPPVGMAPSVSGALWISGLVVNGHNLYLVASDGSIFRSTNNGASWSNFFSPQVDFLSCYLSPDALVWANGRILMGTWGDGVFASDNNGASWTAANLGINNLDVGALFYQHGIL